MPDKNDFRWRFQPIEMTPSHFSPGQLAHVGFVLELRTENYGRIHSSAMTARRMGSFADLGDLDREPAVVEHQDDFYLFLPDEMGHEIPDSARSDLFETTCSVLPPFPVYSGHRFSSSFDIEEDARRRISSCSSENAKAFEVPQPMIRQAPLVRRTSLSLREVTPTRPSDDVLREQYLRRLRRFIDSMRRSDESRRSVIEQRRLLRYLYRHREGKDDLLAGYSRRTREFLASRSQLMDAIYDAMAEQDTLDDEEEDQGEGEDSQEGEATKDASLKEEKKSEMNND